MGFKNELCFKNGLVDVVEVFSALGYTRSLSIMKADNLKTKNSK